MTQITNPETYPLITDEQLQDISDGVSEILLAGHFQDRAGMFGTYIDILGDRYPISVSYQDVIAYDLMNKSNQAMEKYKND